MRTLVHLSDLHFGRVDPLVYRPLIEMVHKIAPDVVVVSGDLTQRARRAEFQSARVFLNLLPTPQIVVPGNHDVPLHNVYARFLSGFARYYRYITREQEPSFSDEEISVLGVNTARALVFKGGRVNAEQIGRIKEHFCRAPDQIKVLVAHHPFDLPVHLKEHDLVGRAKMALAGIASCGVDLVLSGHLHLTHSMASRSAIFVQAGTALSTRGRGEENSFNVIRIEANRIHVDHQTWNPVGRSFVLATTEEFVRAERGWRRA